MKRYETMSKEEIMEFFEHCKIGRCENCAGKETPGVLRMVCACAYLQEEVPEPLMVRRYQNICCKQDLTEMLEVIQARCMEETCCGCGYHGSEISCKASWFIDYLCELEPERPAEWYKEAKYDKSRKIKE